MQEVENPFLQKEMEKEIPEVTIRDTVHDDDVVLPA